MENNQLSQATEPADARPQRQMATPQRILVVDDDHAMRSLNTEVLIHHGYHVDAVEDGAIAWDALQLNSYDLIITDNNMPNVTGVGLLKKMRAARMALPVIMATGVLPQDEFVRYPWLQPAATLVKPYTLVQLLGTVQKVLEANEGAGEWSAPPDCQSHPTAEGWRL